MSKQSHHDSALGKHSTGDLLSRLKTRKVLGVGETENGDVHRSKISQLLGHNEHLYMKLPKGWWAWQVAMATCMTCEGALLLFFPNQADQILFPSLVEHSSESASQLMTAHQCHGAALLGLAFLLWKFFHSKDKAEARATTSVVGMYHFLLATVIFGNSIRTRGITSLIQPDCYILVGLRSMLAVASGLFSKWIGSSTSGMRKSSSYKDLVTTVSSLTDKFNTEATKKDM